MSSIKPIILIVGPTAGGKTQLAIDLASNLPGGGECICADSMQIYRGMDIGTAKPTKDEQNAVPHHLFDIAEPADNNFSVDRWLELAELQIEQIRNRNAWPIVVGGTNLYVKALLEGLFNGPKPNMQIRKELESLDNESLRKELLIVDPEAATRIHPNDRKRSIRAIEVFRETNIPISMHQRQWNSGNVKTDVRIIGLDYPAEVINSKINARVRKMIAKGLVEEARTLWVGKKLGPQASEALGYKQLIMHFAHEYSLEEAIEEIKIRTRRFAKHQRTWLKQFRHLPDSYWIDMSDSDAQVHVNTLVTWILQRDCNPTQ